MTRTTAFGVLAAEDSVGIFWAFEDVRVVEIWHRPQ